MIDRSAYILFYQKKRITSALNDGPKAKKEDNDIDSVSFEIPISIDSDSELESIH